MKFLKGSPEDFYKFVGEISEGDKIGIVTHTDLDGLASAIFLKKILESRNLKVPSIKFLDYGKEGLEDLLSEDFDVLFFTDWNLDSFKDYFEKLNTKFRIFVVDHHPCSFDLGEKNLILKTSSHICASYVLFELAKKYFDVKDFEWLVCVAIIADYGFIDDEVLKFLKECYPEIEKDNVHKSEPGEFSAKISRAIIYYAPDYRKVFDFVLKKDFDSLEKANKIIGDEIEKWVKKFLEEHEHFSKKNLRFYYAKPEYRIVSQISNVLSRDYFPDDIIIFVSDKLSKKGFVKLSARNQRNIPLGRILKKCVEGFENADAGGHNNAAAGCFPRRYLKTFKERVLEFL